jgi:acyl dehydratase
LLYRLTGDLNPLHADPAVASKAGFAHPILHGLASYALAGYAILRSFCHLDPSRFHALSCRFTGPAYPGETFQTRMWKDGPLISFETRTLERDVVVLGNGCARIAD